MLFETRAHVLKTVPHFLKGPYRTAMRIALTEASCGDELRRVTGRKLCLILPRVLLSLKPRGGLIIREQLTSRFSLFSQGWCTELIRASEQDAEDASTARCRRLRCRSVDVERRAARAQMLVQLGELSSGRQALEAAEVAPGTLQTLQALRDPSRRPRPAREAISRELLDFEPATSLELDEGLFSKNLRSARRGATAGPSGMTTDHSRPSLDNVRDPHLLFSVREQLATGKAPQEVVEIGRMGRLTALKKPNGKIRGIVSGEGVRRLVSRTIAQQVSKAVEAGTAPFQCALFTKAGSECVAHALQALCELDPSSTVVSVDGIGAFDLVSAMLQGLRRIAPHVVPFVRQFYGTPSTYWWENDEGVTHHAHQGEGGEQGDPLMPILFALGQHPALVAALRRFHAGERLFASLDDMYVVTTPDRVGAVHAILSEELWPHSRICHGGKTQVWNAAGIRPPACDELDRVAQLEDPEAASVWRGGDLPIASQGIKVLGTPHGHDEFVEAHLARTFQSDETLLERIPTLPDVQSAWALLLHCANARAT